MSAIDMPLDSKVETASPFWWTWIGVGLAAVAGLALMIDSARTSSATYDEVAYLKVGCQWWRTGKADAITRMGSPLLFWKLQQTPTLLMIDTFGHREWIDDPITHQEALLPWIRIGGLWIWVVGLITTALWARESSGPRAMVFAAWLFAMSPNLLAHGALATMETPILTLSAIVFYLAWRFLIKGSKVAFWSAAIACGVAFGCKFTAIVFPFLIAAAWLMSTPWSVANLSKIAVRMFGFVALMLLTNFVVNGGAALPISGRIGERHPAIEARLGPMLGKVASRLIETPVPQDWAGFVKQIEHQRSGGSSYLLGVRRMKGWISYYWIALLVKVPLTFWMLPAIRASRNPLGRSARPLAVTIIGFMALATIGSARNYGIRYLLPMSPLAIVWVSANVETAGWRRRLAVIALAGQAFAVASIHPHELTYFNAVAGGPVGGRKILADSNLDWGQGLKSLAKLQAQRPELRDLTLYYFGDTEPRFYQVAGTSHVIDANGSRSGLPPTFEAHTQYVAVSASLQWGPWGPDGYFRTLNHLQPIAYTHDTTIAIYRSSDVSAIGKKDEIVLRTRSKREEPVQ